VQRNKTKEDDNEHQLVVFSRCTRTKQNKMTMNVDLSSSSLGAQKQNKTRQRQASVHHCFPLCAQKQNKKK
jgi:hypothetical protein